MILSVVKLISWVSHKRQSKFVALKEIPKGENIFILILTTCSAMANTICGLCSWLGSAAHHCMMCIAKARQQGCSNKQHYW